MFSDYTWNYDPMVLLWCEKVVIEIFGRGVTGWKRKGSWMEYWKNGRRIALAPHKTGLSIYFTNRDGSPAIYKEMGGLCNVGKCVIRVEYGRIYDKRLLKYIIGKYL